MNNNFEIKDILFAVNVLLNNKKVSSKNNYNTQKNKILVLNNEVKTKSNKNDIPLDTQKIILEAEKYIKK
tara:strand:+ start:2226 stop:2435 length:210 start_codon:yes stop_codon:yes gene_type:complete